MLKNIYNLVFGALPVYIWEGIIAFVATMIIALALKYFLQTLGRKLISKTDTELDDLLLDVILPRIKSLAIFIGLYLGVEQISKGSTIKNRTLFVYAEGIIYVFLVYFITILLIRLIDTTLKYKLNKHTASSNLTIAVLPILSKITTILAFLVATVTSLEHFGVNVSGLLVFLGGGSVAIALAAQETLANMIAGFVIMIDRPFRIGDRIKIPSGEIGDVYEIGLRSTKILDFDNNLIVCPNSDLTKTKVINYSYPNTDIRVLVDISVAYGTQIEKAKTIILELANQHPDILNNPKPEIFLSSFSEAYFNLQLIARTNDWKKKGRIESLLREQIYSEFLKANISSGYLQHVVQLKSENNK